ncbi:MAG: DEAD/DEAH box helicase [Desulfovibrio sp.]|nr:DEAD/DEAH box helicase [Desulfovibrio sp.]
MSYSEIRLSTHAFVPKSELKAAPESIMNALTITSRFEDKLKIDLSKQTATHFGYPLYLRDYKLFTDNLIDERSCGSPIDIHMASDFSLRENQKPILENFQLQLQLGRTGWLINMPTGSGKTIIACAMMQKIAKTTLIIVPREHLLNQWKERILQFTDTKEEEIGLAQQDICDFEQKKIVLGMIHSLAKDKYPTTFKNFFGLVIWDEVHVAAAQTFSQTLSIFAPKYRIGMSATLQRRDGLDDIYRWSIGEETLSINPHTLITPTIYQLTYKTKKKNNAIEFINNTQHRRGMLISTLAKDNERNALLAIQIKKIAATGRRLVVFSERKQQLQTLLNLLHKDNIENVQLFTGDTKESERKQILETSSVLLATYGVMSMGIDVPDLRALIFATPQSNVAQTVGRILRLCPGTLDPIVIDLIDVVYQDCIYWSRSRKKFYTQVAQAKIIPLE